MAGRLGRRQLTVVNESLDQRMVAGDLAELPVTEQVRPRVPDMADGEAAASPEHRGQGGAHSLNRAVGDAHLVQRGNGRYRDRAGDLASRMPAHAVGYCEQVRPGVRRVLVALAQEADVGTDRIAECKCHLRSSRTVFPMRIGTPTGTGVGSVTRCRSR